MDTPPPSGAATLGRYAIYGKIASGGMASVYYGRQLGDVGFSRVVAVKRMQPRFAKDPQFVAMFLDEATLASRIRHPNVVATLDLVADGREILIVMEYVRALSLSLLLERVREPVPVAIAAAISTGILAGLHAAHEARGRKGESLGIVHRDVSPHNVLVGADGVPRIMDFGIAKATRQLHVTGDGQIKGKLSYMAPEQLVSAGRPIDRTADVFAAGVVLWGMLAGEPLFRGGDLARTMADVLHKEVPPLAGRRRDVPPALDMAIQRALERDRERRWPTARDFEEAIGAACATLATPRAVGAWMERLGGDQLAERDAEIARIESSADDTPHGDDPLALVTEDSKESLLDEPTLERPSAPAEARDGPDAFETRRDVVAKGTRVVAPPVPALEPPPPRARRRWAMPAGIAVVGAFAVALVVGLAASRPDAPSPTPAQAAPPPSEAPETSRAPAATAPVADTAGAAAGSASAVEPRADPSATGSQSGRAATVHRTSKPPSSAAPSSAPPPEPTRRGDPGFFPERP